MNYNEMKEIDLLSFSTKEEAKEEINKVVDSDINDVLRYINYLRFKQFNSEDFTLMDKISKFLFFEEIAEIERDYNDVHDFGAIEELEFETEVVIADANQIIVENNPYICVAQFSDNFEQILITRNGPEYKKFGCIIKGDEPGMKYIYELPPESDIYYNTLEKSDIGVKANILSSIISELPTVKTFMKEEINVEDFDFIFSRKTDKGVLSNIISGTFVILKEETLIETTKTFKEQEDERAEQARIEEEERLAKEKELENDDADDDDDVSYDDVIDVMNDINKLRNQKNAVQMYEWHIQTNDVEDYVFYGNTFEISSIEELETTEDGIFDKNDNFSIDGGNREALEDFYEEDEDDSFYLIPKSEIIRIWSTNDSKTITPIATGMGMPNFGQSNTKEVEIKTLFETSEPTDIVILGSTKYGDNYEGNFSDYSDVYITDDYSSFNITRNKKIMWRMAESDGFISIMTVQDFLKNIDQDNKEYMFDAISGFLLKDFVGEINLNVKVDDVFVDPNTFGETLKYDHSYGEDVDVDAIIDITDENVNLVELNTLLLEQLENQNEKTKYTVEISSNTEKEGFVVSDVDSSGACEWEKIEDYYGNDIDDIIKQVYIKYNITDMNIEESITDSYIADNKEYFLEIYAVCETNEPTEDINFLNEQLKKAIEKEDYTVAAQIKAKIDKLK